MVSYTTTAAANAKNAVLDQLVIKVAQAKLSNNNKIPYGYVSKLVRDISPVCPWLNRNHINHRLKCDEQRAVLLSTGVSPPPVNLVTGGEDISVLSESSNSNTPPNSVTEITITESVQSYAGGRPSRSTNKKRKVMKWLSLPVTMKLPNCFNKSKEL